MKWLSRFFPNAQYWWKRGYEDGRRSYERELAKANQQKNLGCTRDDHCPSALQWRNNHDAVVKQFKEYREARERNWKRRKKNMGHELQRRYSSSKSRRRMEYAKKGWCIYCGLDAYTIDHMTPVSRGGTNDPENLVIACRACNMEKGNMTYDEYMTWRKYHKPD